MLLQYCLRLWQSICWYYVNSISSIIECVLSNLIIVQFWIRNSASTYILFSSSKPVKLNASIKLHSNSALKHDSTKSPVKKSPLDKSHHPHNTAIKKEAISPVSFVIFILLCTQPNSTAWKPIMLWPYKCRTKKSVSLRNRTHFAISPLSAEILYWWPTCNSITIRPSLVWNFSALSQT